MNDLKRFYFFCLLVCITILITCNGNHFSNSPGVSTLITLTESQMIGICQGLEFQLMAHPTTQRNYIICVPGGGVEKQCPTGECFEEHSLLCTANCNANTNTAADQATKDYCNRADTALLDRVANDKNCESYFICVGRNIDPLAQKCPPNRHFSEEQKTCLSYHEANCAASSKWCKRRRNGTRFLHVDCHKYYECQNETTVAASCSYGEHFSPDLKKCVSGICQDDKRTPDCKDLNDGARLPHTKCYKYYVCLNRSVYEVQCPTGYYFDKTQSHACERDVNNNCNEI